MFEEKRKQESCLGGMGTCDSSHHLVGGIADSLQPFVKHEQHNMNALR
jgi:hypothetical protein